MNKPQYKMISQYLKDINTYYNTKQECDNRIMKKIRKLANKYELFLTKMDVFFTTISFSTVDLL